MLSRRSDLDNEVVVVVREDEEVVVPKRAESRASTLSVRQTVVQHVYCTYLLMLYLRFEVEKVRYSIVSSMSIVPISSCYT